MTPPHTITVEVRIAWWVHYLYMPMLIGITKFVINYINQDAELDYEKVRAVIMSGTKIYMNGRRIK